MNVDRIHIESRLAVLAVLILGIAPASAGQPAVVTLDPAKAITQYTHHSWTADDGLPQNSVYAIAQSDDGYLWIGTDEGLTRFDGIEFHTFGKHTDRVFKTNSITSLLSDVDGRLRVGTRGGGVVTYDHGAFSSIGEDDGLPSAMVTSLYEDERGTLWVGTYEGGLAAVDKAGVHVFGADAGLEGTIVNGMTQDENGVLSVGTDAGLFMLSGDRFVRSSDPLLASAFIAEVYRDSGGGMWYTTRNGLIVNRDHDDVHVYNEDRSLSEGPVINIAEDSEATIWFGLSSGGLLRYSNGSFDRLLPGDGFAPGAVTSMVEDREGSFWIGTDGGGLTRLRDAKFTTYSSQEGLPGDAVFSVFQDISGVLWVATDGGIATIHRGEVRQRRLLAPGVDALAIGGDGAGTIWIGTYGAGLVRVYGKSVTSIGARDGLASDAIFVLYSDRSGALWIGTDQGLSKRAGGRIATVNTTDGLSSDFISAVAEGPNGRIWVGTYDSGINLLHGDTVTHISTEDGLSNDAILALYEDSDGILWTGTWGGGLNRIEGEQITIYDVENGLFNDNVFAIVEDDYGSLWMTCNKGIFRIDKSELNAVASGSRTDVSSVVYGLQDGLRSVEANGGQQPAAWKSADGTLWFPTVKGVTSIHPGRIRLNEIQPPVVIEQLAVDGKPVSITGSVSLPPGSDKLAFKYTALSLAAPDRIRFKYRLEGKDTDWFDAQNRREAFYTNIDPGDYTLRVIASNDDGVWNEEGAALQFTLRPYFYQTTWFLVVCITFLLLSAFAGHRLHIRHLQARQRELERIVDERTRDLREEKEKTEKAKDLIEKQAERLKELDRFKTKFFANVSHEFRTPLTMIVGPLENALQGVYGSMNPRIKKQATIMLRNALRLMRLINQLLDIQKLEAGKMQLLARPRDIIPFVEGIVVSCSPFAEKKHIDLSFKSDVDRAELYFEPDKLEKVFFNLLSNASKFTPENGEIAVSIKKVAGEGPDQAADGMIEIRVRDSGRGIPEADLPHIFDRFHQVDGSNTRKYEGTGIGLSLVKELVILHKGTVHVTSEVGQGTEFVILLPTGSAHLQKDEIAERSDDDDGDEGRAAATQLLAAELDLTSGGDEAEQELEEVATPGQDAALILVADDNKDVREYIAGILSDVYRVKTAPDGQAALEVAERVVPDLIISDVMMPRMDGNEFCRRVKTDAELSHIPVILLTAKATHETKLIGLEVGADDYMSKPFNATELRARVKNLLSLRKQEKAVREMNDHLADLVQEQVETILTERERYERELIDARDRAEASARLKSNILNNMSHEFRTPITGILGFAQVLSSEVPEGLREFVDHIDASGHRLLKTLEDVLDLSRIDAEAAESDNPAVDLIDSTRRALDNVRAAAEARDLRITFNEPAGRKLMSYVDEAGYATILDKLLDNAVKFTDEGSIDVSLRGVDGHVELVVRDTGVGVGADYVPHMYDAFTQESSGYTREYEGSGIGLAVVKGTVDAMAGTIEVETERGKGTAFTVRIPDRRQAGAEALAGNGEMDQEVDRSFES